MVCVFRSTFWAFLCISQAPFSRSLWSGHHWKDLLLLQKLSIDDANFGQKWWRQKRKKAKAGMGVNGFKSLRTECWKWFGFGKCLHIKFTPLCNLNVNVIREHDWLPIEEHIVLKSLSLTFKCLNDLVPPYLYNLNTKYVPRYNLRSINGHHLGAIGYKRSRFGARLFSVASAKLWNTLLLNIGSSDNLMQFKYSLKRHFFRKAF